MIKQDILFALDITHPGGAPIRPGASWETYEDLLGCWIGDIDDLPSMPDLEDALKEHIEIEEKKYKAQLSRKTWDNSASFLAEFDMMELASMSLSTDPIVAAMRLLLSTWAGPLWNDDPRVIMGINSLVGAKIISEEKGVKIMSR